LTWQGCGGLILSTSRREIFLFSAFHYLIKAPKKCMDYVILHELCHIAEHNHSERFWRLLTQVMPNWKEVKSRLDSMAELYLNE
jgi:predicted metal-dependent hydrolase|tara:strand:- start:623 stop:874 length:252 start_codon:yes stop_codon:yes gene_type:complete